MKRNTQAYVRCGEGRLTIAGFETLGNKTKVIFAVTDQRTIGDVKKHLDAMAGVKNSIVTYQFWDRSRTLIVFEYEIEGEIRNPKGLLKSVRFKVLSAIWRADMEQLRLWEDGGEECDDEDEDDLDAYMQGQEDNAR